MTEQLKNKLDEAQTPDSSDRRRFLASISMIAGAVASAIMGIPVLGFSLGSVFAKRSRAWKSVGLVEQFEIGKTVLVSFENAAPLPWDGVTAKTAAWLRRETENEFIAFAVNCTHLGCPVRWAPDANLFLCPCHGGVYYSNGEVAAGPPPRPLSRYDVRLRNGQVEIQAGPIPMEKT